MGPPQIVAVGKSVPVTSREEALTKFARAVFNRLFDMARGKEDNPAGVPLLRVEVCEVYALSVMRRLEFRKRAFAEGGWGGIASRQVYNVHTLQYRKLSIIVMYVCVAPFRYSKPSLGHRFCLRFVGLLVHRPHVSLIVFSLLRRRGASWMRRYTPPCLSCAFAR